MGSWVGRWESGPAGGLAFTAALREAQLSYA